MGSAVFGLVWSSAIGVVSEGVVHIFGPVMVITAVLVLMIKFHSNVRGDGRVSLSHCHIGTVIVTVHSSASLRLLYR